MTDNIDMKKLALVSILATSNHQNTSDLLESIGIIGGERFFDFVINSRLAPVWGALLILPVIPHQFVICTRQL